MAKKSNRNSRRSRGMKKIEPSELTITLRTPIMNPGADEDFYCDLSQVASLVNRRFYRQGLNWAVSGFKFLVGGGNQGYIAVQRLPNSWVMSNSWEKGMRAWLRMINEATEESPSIKPAFMDFKIYADSDHHEKGFAGNLLPANAAATAAEGEWESSKIIIPDSTLVGNARQREIIATGDNYPGTSTTTGFSAVSLIEGYANSRALPSIEDPNVPDDMALASGIAPENWLSAMFNEGTSQTEDVLTDARDENNQAPYPFENGIDPVTGIPFLDTMYPGGKNQMPGVMIHDQVTYSSSTVGGQAFAKGGNFPCGLIKFSRSIPSAEKGGLAHDLVVQIDLVPGHHRGYLCQDMKDM